MMSYFPVQGFRSEKYLWCPRSIGYFLLCTANGIASASVIQNDQLVTSLPVQISGKQTRYFFEGKRRSP